MSDREKIRERIRMLRERRVERGCSEAEAVAAAEMVARLMADYGLTDADVEMDRAEARNATDGGGMRDRLWGIIARSTNSACIFHARAEGTFVVFVGRAPGPDIAAYLHAVCDRAINREIALFKRQPLYRRRRSNKMRRQAVAEFTEGMVKSLALRIFTLFRSTRSTEHELAAQRALDAMFPDQVPVKMKEVEPKFVEANSAGWAAGDNVPLNAGVGTAAEARTGLQAAPLAIPGQGGAR